jgi:fatty acid desaturase
MESMKIDWYRTPVDREVLRSLTRKSDLRGLAQAGSFLAVFTSTSTAAVLLFARGWWVAGVMVCYLHSLFFNFMSMAAAAHELSHGTVFRSRALNEAFYHLFCFLTWNNPVHFRASHMLHHQLTVFRGRDKEVVQVPVAEKLSGPSFLGWLTFDARTFARYVKVNVLHALGKADADYFFWDPLFARDDPRRRAMCAWARLVLAGHLGLVALFAAFGLWPLIYLVVFGSFFASILARLCGAIQHTGLGESTPDWRLICHSVEVNPLIGYLYWNMNYHLEHHMYAAVPFHRLPELHRVLGPDLPVPQKSFSAALRLLREIGRRQAKDPRYVYLPDFPATAAPPKRR